MLRAGTPPDGVPVGITTLGERELNLSILPSGFRVSSRTIRDISVSIPGRQASRLSGQTGLQPVVR